MDTLSQSNAAWSKNLGLKPSAESDGSFIENMDVDTIENVASNLLDQSGRSDFICEDTDRIDNEYSKVGTKNQIDNKTQIVNIKKLLDQLSSSRVVLERLPDSIISQKLRPYESSKLDIENKNNSSVDPVPDAAVVDPSKIKSVRTRYCSKCKVVVPNSDKLGPNASCTKCGTPLHYQCVYCTFVFTKYPNFYRHHKKRSCGYVKLDYDSKNKLRTMIKRYCSHCKAVDPNVNCYGTVCAEKLCTKCENPLHYQCVHCYRVFTRYATIPAHLKLACRFQNKCHKCNKCSFETSYKFSLKRHIIAHHTLNRDKDIDNITTDVETVDAL